MTLDVAAAARRLPRPRRTDRLLRRPRRHPDPDRRRRGDRPDPDRPAVQPRHRLGLAAQRRRGRAGVPGRVRRPARRGARRHRPRAQRDPADVRLLPRAGRAPGSQGDNVVVSRLDHDANVRPWVQAAEHRGVEVRWLELDPATAELDLGPLATTVDDRTRLVAVTGASNLLGTIPPVRDGRRPGARGRRAALRGRRAPRRRTGCPTWRRSAPTCSSARPTSSSGRTAACSPPTRRCSRRSTRTSCCRRPTRSRNASSSARCRTRSSPGRPRPWTSSPTCPAAGRRRRPRRDRLEHTHAAVAEHEAALRDRLEAGLAGARRPGRRALPRGRPHADAVPDVPRPAQRGRRAGPARARRARAGRVVLRRRAVPGARRSTTTRASGSGSPPTPTTDEVDRLLAGLAALV